VETQNLAKALVKSASIEVTMPYAKTEEGKTKQKACNAAYEKSAKCKAYRSTWKNENADKHREYSRKSAAKRRIEQPDKVLCSNRKIRAKRKAAYIPLTESEEKELLLLERKRIEMQQLHGNEFHIDHILPLSKGGIHHPINCRILSATENIRKKDSITEEAKELIPIIESIKHERQFL
jgi:hypothetical protein